MSRNHMTPEEAKRKWCPMTRIPIMNLATNRPAYPSSEFPGDHQDEYACIADRCALWCWNPNSNTEGFCGLRGKMVIP